MKSRHGLPAGFLRAETETNTSLHQIWCFMGWHIAPTYFHTVKDTSEDAMANNLKTATEKTQNGESYLHLVYDKAGAIKEPKDELLKEQSTSVPPSRLLPNGGRKDITEESIEQGKAQLIKYFQGDIAVRDLYKNLRAIWGKDTFEDTRHCFENMKQRCRKDYATLDSRFEEFPEFLFFMGPRPDQNASIHRKANSDGYSPENCIWADKLTQSRVRRNIVSLTLSGETLPLTEWAELLGITPSALRSRKENGWSESDILQGRRDKNPFSAPQNSPWPGSRKDQWEYNFRMAGGKTHDDRLAYLMACAKLKLRQLHEDFRYDWDSSYTPSVKEKEDLKVWEDTHAAVQSSYREAEKLLRQRMRFDLIRRSKEESISQLFHERN